MRADILDRPDTGIRRFLTSENEVLRSAAIRALPSLGDTDNVHAALLEARMDPDPDVRSDAMEALVTHGRAEDAAAVRHSLEGDPVCEVKMAAIKALARLRDADAIEMLRALVLSRADDRVAWEDEGNDWEDWLDIQTAAIDALGQMGVTAAIPDLLTALNDPLGQSVDVPVFRALSGMGSAGVPVLLNAFSQADGAAKRQAADALARVAPDGLAAHLGTLLQAQAPELRRLAFAVLGKDDPRCEALATTDPDPGIRATALAHASGAFPELARKGLADPDDGVKAVALKLLKPPFDPTFHEALVDNMLVWLERGRPILAVEVATQLPTLAPNRAEGPLLNILDDQSRPLEVRVAAAKALERVPLVATSLLVDRLDNPAHQVRVALLIVLNNRALANDEAATEALASSIAGKLDLAPVDEPPVDTSALDAGTPKEGAGPRKIRITAEGDIVDWEDETDWSQSTLETILSGADVAEPQQAEDTPEESGAKRAKRRPVEGSGDLTQLVAIDAMRICTLSDRAEIAEAVMGRTSVANDSVRRIAWQALARLGGTAGNISRAETAFRDPDPTIRLAAFRILAQGQSADAVAEGLSDEDPLIQAEAVSILPSGGAIDFVGSGFSAVRSAAIAKVLGSGNDGQIARAVDKALASERVDAVAALASSKSAKSCLRATLSDSGTPDRTALVALRALDAQQT